MNPCAQLAENPAAFYQQRISSNSDYPVYDMRSSFLGKRGRPPRDSYANEYQGGFRVKREGYGFGLKREFDDMMLPFRTKRVEKQNNNGEKKQARLEIRKRMINERVKQRQRYISAKKIEAIQELIDKGELPASSLRWKTRQQLAMAKQGVNPLNPMIKSEDGMIKSENGELKPGDHRATPCRWSSHEKKRFIELLKTMGKQFAKIAEIIKTKNEQQCRTKALILYNKLKCNNFDNKLYEILAPTRPPPGAGTGRKKKRYVPKSERLKKEALKNEAGDIIKKENPDERASSVEPEEDIE
jgi:hypothetical protein